MTSAIKHGNRHAMIATYNDVIFVVKLLVVEKMFEETLGCDFRDNAESTNTNLF